MVLSHYDLHTRLLCHNHISYLQYISLQWRHYGRNGIPNHRPLGCLINRLFRRRSKKTSKLRVVGLCAGNSPVTGEFPAQRASNAENVSIWWRHHVVCHCQKTSEQIFDWQATSTWQILKRTNADLKQPLVYITVHLYNHVLLCWLGACVHRASTNMLLGQWHN